MKQGYDVRIERDVPAVMRDGVTLYADVWRPDAEGVFPVLLTRTPYDKNQPRNAVIAGVDPLRTVREGYVVIYQDVRGRFASEGRWSFENELDDGYDSVEWAAGLPYADGNVGMFGVSYLGLTQWMAAAAAPPHLKAILPMQMGSGPADFLKPSHALSIGSVIYWAAGMAADAIMRRAVAGEDVQAALVELLHLVDHMPEAFERLPLLDPGSSLAKVFPDFAEWISRSQDADYWDRRGFGQRLGSIDVPILHVGSWHDVYPGAVPALFTRMRAHGASESVRAAQKLIMGPWAHAQTASDVIGDLYMGLSATAALIDLPGLHLKWFDHWLKGRDNGVMAEPPVRLFVMGANTWRTEQEWPLARTQWTKFFLHSDGRANTGDGDGRLDRAAPTTAEPHDTYVYDPRHPVPTHGGPTVLPGTATGANAGPRDQARIEARPDVLVYSTPVLDEDVEVTGPIVATLFAASSAVDTDWTVKLVDVHPDGTAYSLADGICRARYRDGAERPALLQPGQVYPFEIDLQCTSNLFKAGHRIRIQVSSSNFPRFSRNLNTGGPIETDTELRQALQAVHHDTGHPSHITLPIIPRKTD